jgi:LysM repeat protein
MTEVTLVKRFYALMLITLVALFASACTREKPADTPVPTVIAQRTVVTPPPLGTVVAAGVSATIAPTLVLTPTTPVAVVIVTLTQVLPPTTPVVAPSPTTNPGTYTVQWGDWLNKIAAQFGVSAQAIIAANPGIHPNFISPGQVLQIPGNNAGLTPVPTSVPSTNPPATNPSTYTVQRGDWIYALARRFGVSVAALVAANPGKNPNLLYPGQVLTIPSGTSSTLPPDPGTPPSGNTYTVQPGDTLFAIAVRFKTSILALQIQNKLANPNFISPGQVLAIPQ